MTPMMQQYQEAKERHPGMLLLFRMGDFFELFDDDAETAAKVLGLTLTSRDKTTRMAGFPHHQLENYLHKLLRTGHRVAICDQVEEASTPLPPPSHGGGRGGLVRREVTRVVTPGTITEDDLLDPRQNNHLVALCNPPRPPLLKGERITAPPLEKGERGGCRPGVVGNLDRPVSCDRRSVDTLNG